MTSYRRLLRHRDFRFLFLGESASAVGDEVVIVALALDITQRTGSPTDLGLVLVAQSLPLIGLVLFGGVWADRLPRHRIMTAADYARAVLHAVLAASIVLGGASVAEMIVIEALFGAARAFFQPAYSGLLPQTIPDAANDSRYGLQAAIFTADLSDALKAARTLDYGGVLVNEVPTFRADQQPYGGNRDSGNTREGPQWAVREMTEERLVVIQM